MDALTLCTCHETINFPNSAQKSCQISRQKYTQNGAAQLAKLQLPLQCEHVSHKIKKRSWNIIFGQM